MDAECVEGNVQIVGGVNETEGRVEVCLGGSWGGVCFNSWTYEDARVVCKQLGYPYTGMAIISLQLILIDVSVNIYLNKRPIIINQTIN